MARFLIKRLRPALQEKARWAPLGAVLLPLKPNDYLDDGDVEGGSAYQAWAILKAEDRLLQVGDLLVTEQGKLLRCTYSGFEDAEWLPQADSGIADRTGQQPVAEDSAAFLIESEP